MKKIFTKLAVLVGLVGCGPLAQERPIVRLGTTAAALVTQQVDSTATTPSVELTRAAIEEAPGNLLRISLISAGATDLVGETGRNGTKVTWLSNDGFGFTFDEGLLVATRKTGSDLMGADVSGAKRSLEGGGNHMRTLDFIDGLDQIQQIVMQCQTVITGQDTLTIFERTYHTSIIEETCEGAGQEFKNTYWRDQSGVIWQSRQWISPQAGYLGYQRL